MNNSEPTPKDPYRGFNLKSVCWGYRDIFQKTIEGLFDQGLLGEERQEVTQRFFGFLKNADQHCYDHVLKEFLCAITPRTRWLLDLPGIFTDVVETGRLFAEAKLYFGIGYFRLFGEERLGDTPAKIRHALTIARRLLEIDGELAYAFLRGCRALTDRLKPDEIERFIEEGLRIYTGNHSGGYKFMAAESKAAENIIRMLTQECRLQDEKESLTNLIHALTSVDVEIDDFSKLDSDDLIEYGSRMITMYRWLYLPARFRHFSTSERNRDWYRLCVVAAASMLAEGTFASVHGHPEYETGRDLAGDDPARVTLFCILEYLRGLRCARRRWPGSRRLITLGLETEFSVRPPESASESFFEDAAREEPQTKAGRRLAEASDSLINVFDTVRFLDSPEGKRLLSDFPELGKNLMRPYSFLPDLLFPGRVHNPPPGSMIADMKEQADSKSKREGKESEEEEAASPAGADTGETGEEEEADAVPARFWYPEWNQMEGEYYENWCGVAPMTAGTRGGGEIPSRLSETAKRVRRVFERLKPDLTRNERRLETGDYINMERLIDYRVNSRIDADPRIDFYEKPLITRRDLAVLILMDVSGSTSETTGKEKVLEIEKHAALILGQGLSVLGDRFAVGGFSSNGREQCEYYLFKDFSDSWNDDTRSNIMGAYPRNSTRMGAALRHSGYLLSKVEAKQRLILLVTDGKPMDAGYDPESRYAQHDVRMACEENEKQSIATFAITTVENSLADMEIMFPHKRFAILPDISRLPDVLPRMYLKITA